MQRFDRRRSAAALLAALVALCCLICAAESVWPEATGKTRYKDGGTTVDASNAGKGYIMAKHKKSDKRLKLRVSKGDDMATYDLNGSGEYEVFPLQFGNGSYKVRVYKQVKGTQYSQASSLSFKVKLSDANAPYLCPNQYVWYESDSAAVLKSKEICEGLTTDEEKVKAVYDYVVRNVRYHYIRALTVETGYIPQVDQVLDEGMGICFDFAAVVACMLRVRGVPTQLVIGYADDAYHAWNNIYLNGEWRRYDATADVTNMNVGVYTEERRY